MPEIPCNGSEVKLTYTPVVDEDRRMSAVYALVGKFGKSYCVLVHAYEHDGKTNYFLSPYAEFPDANSAYELALSINKGEVEAFGGIND